MGNLTKNKKQKLKPRRRLSERERDDSSMKSDNFKRNTTWIKGYKSVNYNQAKQKPPLVEQTPRMITHDLSTKRRRIFGVFVLVILVVLALWLLLFNFTAEPIIHIENDDVVRTIDKNYYQDAIQSYLSANPVYRLTPFDSQSALTAYVAKKFPEIALISINGSAGIGKTNFVVTLRKPVAGWKINNKQYYVDSSGVQFEANYFSEPGVQIVDEGNVAINTSGTVTIASRRFLSFVGRIVSLAKNYGYTVTKAILPTATTRELEINIAEKGYLIKLSIDRPAGEQVEDMKNAITYFDKHGISPSYVNLRVSGRAYYK